MIAHNQLICAGSIVLKTRASHAAQLRMTDRSTRHRAAGGEPQEAPR